MEAIRLKLLVPACCPNCGYNLQPDNPIVPVKLMHTGDEPDGETIEGLFNYVKPVKEPPVAPSWPRSRTPSRERRTPYEEEEAGRRSQKGGKRRGRGQKRNPKFEPVVGPPINFIQKRLLEIASKDVGEMQGSSPNLESIAAGLRTPERGTSGPPIPGVVTVNDELFPAIPNIKCSVPCSQSKQNEVYQMLTEFLEDVDTQQAASPRSPTPQIPIEAPRPTKVPWQAKRVLIPESVLLQTGDPPGRNPFGGAPAPPKPGFWDTLTAAVSAPVPPPVDRGRVVAIHNHFYGETVVIPDTP